jgi:hypothetical protein
MGAICLAGGGRLRMVTKAQIERLSGRIEAIGRQDAPPRIVVVDPSETKEQALARYERDLGGPLRGPITFIHTGVPRSPA